MSGSSSGFKLGWRWAGRCHGGRREPRGSPEGAGPQSSAGSGRAEAKLALSPPPAPRGRRGSSRPRLVSPGLPLARQPPLRQTQARPRRGEGPGVGKHIPAGWPGGLCEAGKRERKARRSPLASFRGTFGRPILLPAVNCLGFGSSPGQPASPQSL